MSGRKKLERATRSKRVIAIPRREITREVNGREKKIQLYRIIPMR